MSNSYRPWNKEALIVRYYHVLKLCSALIKKLIEKLKAEWKEALVKWEQEEGRSVKCPKGSD